ncbi:MAG: HNH endonuclease [Bacteroidia bacterium]
MIGWPMNKIKFSFIALGGTMNFEFESNESVIKEFVSIFSKSEVTLPDKVTVKVVHRNTEELRRNVAAFVDKYKHQLQALNQYNLFFKRLSDGEEFCFLPGTDINDLICQQAVVYLSSSKNGRSYKEQIEIFNDTFKTLFETYDFTQFDELTKKSIGEPDKSKRVCRFCGKKQPETTFKGRAHAISEALGNKSLVLNEECDTCNEMFGTGIEVDLITMIRHMGTLHGIKGKDGIPVIKEKNFELTNNGVKPLFKYLGTEGNINQATKEAVFPLEFTHKIIRQNIYKTLVKYAMSLVDTEQLTNFTETIKWINGDKPVVGKLPRVAILADYDFYTSHPVFFLYQRKNDNLRLPYMVCHFQYIHIGFVFIIPFCSKDDRSFVEDDEFQFYWNFFKHFSNPEFKFSFHDFSETEPKAFKFNLNIKNINLVQE